LTNSRDAGIIRNVFVTNMLYSFTALVKYLHPRIWNKMFLSFTLSRQNWTVSRWVNKFFSYADNSSALQLHKQVLRPLVIPGIGYNLTCLEK